MQLTSFVVAVVLSLTLPLFTVAEHNAPSRRHTAIAQRKRGDVQTLQKRAFSGHATWYDVGLGACGQYNGPSDFIVALNTPQYGGGYPGPNCFKSITISAKGKTANAVIMDQCPGCPYGSLDFSVGLFKHFSGLDEGLFDISWWFNDGSAEPAPAPAPAPTTSKKKTTTTHWQEPTPTPWVDPSPWTSYTTSKTKKSKTKTSTSTTETPTSTSTWSESVTSTTAENTTTSSTESAASSSAASSTYPSESLAPTASPAVATKAATGTANIALVNELVLGLAQLVRN